MNLCKMLVPSNVCTHLLYQRLGPIAYWNATGMQSLRDVCPTSSDMEGFCGNGGLTPMGVYTVAEGRIKGEGLYPYTTWM